MKNVAQGRGGAVRAGRRASLPHGIWPALLLLALLLGSGCSTLPETSNVTEPPLRTYEALPEDERIHMLDVKDSVEGFNRGTYRFNYYFDEYLFRPVVKGYEFIMPNYLEDRVSNAVDNLNEFTNLTNNLLQLRFKAAGITLSRFVINSIVGIAGLWDPAESWGLDSHAEDFGQTLGCYGVHNGSYIVLPVLGPSNVRDTTGFVTDTAAFTFAGPPGWLNNTAATVGYNTVAAIDKRHRVPFRYRQTGSPFEYELLRTLYTLKREYDVKH